jgi:hypothetical protein
MLFADTASPLRWRQAVIDQLDLVTAAGSASGHVRAQVIETVQSALQIGRELIQTVCSRVAIVTHDPSPDAVLVAQHTTSIAIRDLATVWQPPP